MKDGTVLKVNEEIVPLSSDEENTLKGGFGIVETDLFEPRWGSKNKNCTNSSLSHNTNCKCDSCGSGSSTRSYY